jgi:hypothetical protein
MPKKIGNAFAGFDLIVKTGSITSVETIGSKPMPGTTKK